MPWHFWRCVNIRDSSRFQLSSLEISILQVWLASHFCTHYVQHTFEKLPCIHFHNFQITNGLFAECLLFLWRRLGNFCAIHWSTSTFTKTAISHPRNFECILRDILRNASPWKLLSCLTNPEIFLLSFWKNRKFSFGGSSVEAICFVSSSFKSHYYNIAALFHVQLWTYFLKRSPHS